MNYQGVFLRHIFLSLIALVTYSLFHFFWLGTDDVLYAMIRVVLFVHIIGSGFYWFVGLFGINLFFDFVEEIRRIMLTFYCGLLLIISSLVGILTTNSLVPEKTTWFGWQHALIGVMMGASLIFWSIYKTKRFDTQADKAYAAHMKAKAKRKNLVADLDDGDRFIESNHHHLVEAIKKSEKGKMELLD